jgi:cold shock CspA family protein
MQGEEGNLAGAFTGGKPVAEGEAAPWEGPSAADAPTGIKPVTGWLFVHASASPSLMLKPGVRVSFSVEWDEIGRTRAVEVRPLVENETAWGIEVRPLGEEGEAAAGRLRC